MAQDAKPFATGAPGPFPEIPGTVCTPANPAAARDFWG